MLIELKEMLSVYTCVPGNTKQSDGSREGNMILLPPEEM
jgi:hypothetical protein